MKTRKMQPRRKAARERKEKAAAPIETDFYRLEKPEEISKEERMVRVILRVEAVLNKRTHKFQEVEQMVTSRATTRKLGQTQKSDSKQKCEAVRKTSTVGQTKSEKSQMMEPKSDEVQGEAKTRKAERSTRQEVSQTKPRAEVRRLDLSKKVQQSQRLEIPQKSLVVDVSQKTEKRPRLEVSQKTQRSLRLTASRRTSNPLRMESSLKTNKRRKEEASQANKSKQREQLSDKRSIRESPTVEAESDSYENSKI